jgi:hypothetical protein
MATTTIEIDTDLLARLRKQNPGKDDRQLLESLATIDLGRKAVRRAREAFADVDPAEVEAEAVKAVREVRQEMAAERAGA